MKLFLTLIFSLSFHYSFAQSGYNDQEKLKQQIDQNRKEVNDSLTNPNSKTSPPSVLIPIQDDGTRYEIRNHFFGGSYLSENDKTLVGVKITGMFNFAYYNVTKKEEGSETKRNKGRFVVGFEFPMVEFNRSAWFAGIGGTLGDQTGIYLNTGLDYHLLSWLKVQGALNYTSGAGIAPMLNLGLTW